MCVCVCVCIYMYIYICVCVCVSECIYMLLSGLPTPPLGQDMTQGQF